MSDSHEPTALDDTCLFTFLEGARRLEQQTGQRATKEELHQLLRRLDAEVAARPSFRARLVPPPDLEALRTLVRDFCAATGLAQLILWAEETDGQIEVKVLAQAKSPA